MTMKECSHCNEMADMKPEAPKGLLHSDRPINETIVGPDGSMRYAGLLTPLVQETFPRHAKSEHDALATYLRHEAETKGQRTAKRFLAIADLVDGTGIDDAAEKASVQVRTLESWWEKFETDGAAGLQPQTSNAQIRRDIAPETLTTLAKTTDKTLAVRLNAIAKLLKNIDRKYVAIEAKKSPATICRWVQAFNTEGIAGLRGQHQREPTPSAVARHNLSAIDLRSSAEVLDKRCARKLRAVANLLDGMKLSEATQLAGVHTRTLLDWWKKFELGGIRALYRQRRAVTPGHDISSHKLRTMALNANKKTASRFSTIADLLDGDTYEQVANRAGVSISTIYYLVNRFNEDGIAGLSSSKLKGRPQKLTVRNDIKASALRTAAKAAESRASIRFTAIANFLDGMTQREAALAADVSPATIHLWLHRFNANGLAGLSRNRKRGRKLKIILHDGISAAELREAATAADKRHARRILAVANLSEGMPRVEVAKRAGVSARTVDNWRRRFNKNGLSGLQH